MASEDGLGAAAHGRGGRGRLQKRKTVPSGELETVTASRQRCDRPAGGAVPGRFGQGRPGEGPDADASQLPGDRQRRGAGRHRRKSAASGGLLFPRHLAAGWHGPAPWGLRSAAVTPA